MAKKWKVWVEPSGMSAAMKTKEIQAALQDIGNGVVQRAGDGYEANVIVKPNRAIVKVNATTVKAYRSNLKHNTLLKALGG